MENKSLKYFYLVTFISLFLDQFTKYLILNFLSPYSSFHIFKYFSLTLVKNSGVLFGLFSQFDIRIPVIIASVLIGIVIYTVLLKNPSVYKKIQIALGLIEGGIIGNLIDRIKYGYVIDFLNFHFWPVFNLADTFIVSGIFLLFFAHIRSNNASSIYQNR